jgi:hypothetical protein
MSAFGQSLPMYSGPALDIVRFAVSDHSGHQSEVTLSAITDMQAPAKRWRRKTKIRQSGRLSPGDEHRNPLAVMPIIVAEHLDQVVLF